MIIIFNHSLGSGFVALSFLLAIALSRAAAQTNCPCAREIASGPFQPARESLGTHHQCPKWFRNAKFGFWAVYGPQCEAEDRDWHRVGTVIIKALAEHPVFWQDSAGSVRIRVCAESCNSPGMKPDKG